MTSKVTKIAIAAACAGAVALPASGALAASKTDRALIGAVIGGIAGAAVSDGRTEGVAIGALAGAALGAATKNDNHHYRYGYRETRPYYRDGRYARTYDRGYYGQNAYYGQNRYYGQTRYYDGYANRYDTGYGYYGYGR